MANDDAQMKAARRGMEKYQRALAAMASDTGPNSPSRSNSDDFEEQVKLARERMAKYRGALATLAKS